MKKEMMTLIDTMNSFATDFNSQAFKDQKQFTLASYPDVDEYDLGYANGYAKAIYKSARIMASNNELEEFSDIINDNPIDIVTANSLFTNTDDEESVFFDTIPEMVDKEFDDLMEDEDE